ncbi:hypothetical protein CERSUDRAFT_112437 [Gelatoporia subvermispora B]|uniref:REJ domain-containing protein n=1 Tax=Ceriporiopsis subvermispora (strain B) TaxID=914234 RepID=M2R731_CERS8|nr:hypothetical protein CERSUDRAFT_112437 [Gelatoporia subvermispora B]
MSCTLACLLGPRRTRREACERSRQNDGLERAVGALRGARRRQGREVRGLAALGGKPRASRGEERRGRPVCRSMGLRRGSWGLCGQGSSDAGSPTDSSGSASATGGSSSSSAQPSSPASPPPTSPPPSSSSNPPSSPPPTSDSSASATPPPDTSASPPASPSPSDSGSGSSGAPSGSATPPPASSGSSSASSSGSSSASLSSTSLQTMTSTFVTTDAAGSVITSTVVATHTIITSLPPGSNSASSSSGSSSHTGAIVGGVVGGVAGLAALALVIFFLCRRRRRDDFDGNFDPDRVVGHSGGGTLPQIDLAGADEVEPYHYTPSGYGPGPGSMSAHGEMREHNVPPFLAGGLLGAGAAAAGQPGPMHSPPATTAPSAPSAYSHSSSGHYPDYAAYSAYAAAAPPAQDFRHPSPGPSITGSSSVQSPTGSGSALGVLPSAKEREAMGRRGGYVVANQEGEAPPVVQHQDGGRLDSTPEEEEALHEVPPRYDSIPRDR